MSKQQPPAQTVPDDQDEIRQRVEYAAEMAEADQLVIERISAELVEVRQQMFMFAGMVSGLFLALWLVLLFQREARG